MADLKFEKEITGLLLIDLYNDSFPRVARFGIASKLLQKQMIASLICCSC